MLALDAASTAGASYVDARVMQVRDQRIGTREERVTDLRDDESIGIAVRALVGGAWGFVAARTLERSDVVRLARAAVDQARGHSAAVREPVQLAPVDPYPNGEWHTPIGIDPFAVSLEEKVDLLLAANAGARGS
jgi:TldD protein